LEEVGEMEREMLEALDWKVGVSHVGIQSRTIGEMDYGVVDEVSLAFQKEFDNLAMRLRTLPDLSINGIEENSNSSNTSPSNSSLYSSSHSSIEIQAITPITPVDEPQRPRREVLKSQGPQRIGSVQRTGGIHEVGSKLKRVRHRFSNSFEEYFHGGGGEKRKKT
jgi:hypothetical protein